MPQFQAVAAVEREIATTLPIIKDKNADIQTRAKALEHFADVVTNAADEIKEQAQRIRDDGSVIDAAIYKMMESEDALSDFVGKLAQSSTLLLNLKEVFFKYDSKMLRQVIEEATPETRKEAWAGLDFETREAIKAEL